MEVAFGYMLVPAWSKEAINFELTANGTVSRHPVGKVMGSNISVGKGLSPWDLS